MRKTMAAAMLLFGTILSGAPLRGGMIGMADGGEDSLRKLADAFAAAMRAGDAAAVAAVYADDATDMPPGSAPLRGRAAIEAYYRALFATCRFTRFELAYGESRVSGDVGYLVGSSRAAVMAGGAATPEESGKFVVVFRRAKDGWKAAYAIHNDDAPPAGR
jgi:uncharacterized protein (TIGR02246 family)